MLLDHHCGITEGGGGESAREFPHWFTFSLAYNCCCYRNLTEDFILIPAENAAVIIC